MDNHSAGTNAPKTQNPPIDMALVDIAHKRWGDEINLIWTRNAAFWLITALAFTAYYSLITSPDQNSCRYFTLIIASFGFISSFFWTLINRGGKFWQDFWGSRVKTLEPRILGYTLSHIREDDKWNPDLEETWIRKRFSPSRLVIAISDYITALWFFLLMFDLIKYLGCLQVNLHLLFPILLALFTVNYAVIVYRETKVH